MTEGVDYDFPPNPTAAELVAAGKHFAGRYVGAGTSDKWLTAAERDDLFAHGVDIFLLCEGSADGAKGGRTVGSRHAQMARDHAKSLAAPGNTACYFAIDYEITTETQWAPAREYLRGACDVLGLALVGAYGSKYVVERAKRDGVASYFYQTYAWSHGQWFAGNHLEQYLNGQVLPGGGGVDLCRAKQTNFGQWAAPTPSTVEDEMRIVPTPNGTYWLLDGRVDADGKPLLWAHPWEAISEYIKAGVPVSPKTSAELDLRFYHRMPDDSTPPAPPAAVPPHTHELTLTGGVGPVQHDQ